MYPGFKESKRLFRVIFAPMENMLVSSVAKEKQFLPPVMEWLKMTGVSKKERITDTIDTNNLRENLKEESNSCKKIYDNSSPEDEFCFS